MLPGAFAVALALALMGCGGQNAGKGESASTESTGAAATATEAADKPAQEEKAPKAEAPEEDPFKDDPLVISYNKLNKMSADEMSAFTYDDIVAQYMNGDPGERLESSARDADYLWRSENGVQLSITFEEADGVLHATNLMMMLTPAKR